MEEKDKTQSKEELFFHLVYMFETAALQQMGKLANPVTRKIEKNLEQAKYSIDILEVIQEKTKGNLNEGESKFLEHVLFELRMNYLEELKKDEKISKEENKSTGSGQEEKSES